MGSIYRVLAFFGGDVKFASFIPFSIFMKNIYLSSVLVFSFVVLTACSSNVVDDSVVDDLDVDTDTETVIDEESTNEAVDGYLSYDWDRIGLTFEYPVESYGEAVEVTEQKYFDQVYVGNSVSGVTIEPVKLALPAITDELENYLWVNLLDRSETCEIYEISSSDEKSVYGYKTSVSPYEEGTDEDCEILTNLYYFPGNLSYIFKIGTGQTPAFEDEADNAHFFESLMAL